MTILGILNTVGGVSKYADVGQLKEGVLDNDCSVRA